MSKDIVSIGSKINYPTVLNENVSGTVEVILKNTVIIRDSKKMTHLVLKSTILKDGFLVDEETPRHQTAYNNKIKK